MLLTYREIMDIIESEDDQQAILFTSFIYVKGTPMKLTYGMLEEAATGLINMVVSELSTRGILLSDIKFSVAFSGNTMYLDVNSPTVVN